MAKMGHDHYLLIRFPRYQSGDHLDLAIVQTTDHFGPNLDWRLPILSLLLDQLAQLLTLPWREDKAEALLLLSHPPKGGVLESIGYVHSAAGGRCLSHAVGDDAHSAASLHGQLTHPVQITFRKHHFALQGQPFIIRFLFAVLQENHLRFSFKGRAALDEGDGAVAEIGQLAPLVLWLDEIQGGLRSLPLLEHLRRPVPRLLIGREGQDLGLDARLAQAIQAIVRRLAETRAGLHAVIAGDVHHVALSRLP